MKDQHSTSDDREEPERPRTIPADFVWDPEYQGWFAPGEPSGFDVKAFSRNLEKVIAENRGGGLISVDELRAAGALDVPPGWRKSLGKEERDLFSDLLDDGQVPDATAGQSSEGS